MKLNKFFLISSLILLACLPQICAMIDIKIYMEPEFFTGDTISFNYTVDSDTEQTISYMETVDCPNAPHATLDPKSAFVNLVVKVHGKYNYLKVTEDILPQDCTAYVTVLNPIQKTVSKTFAIVTSPSFDFNIILDKKVFVKGENINIDYKSEVKNPLVEATLIYPDKLTEQISLPYSFKAKQIGTYELNVMASKEGYKIVSLNEQFGVIKKDADIEYVTFKEGLVVQEKTNLFERAKEGDAIDKIIIFLICILMGFVVLVFVLEIIKKIKSREK